MAHRTGCNFHPSRISGRAKKAMERAAEQLKPIKVKSVIKPIDLNKPDWTINPSSPNGKG